MASEFIQKNDEYFLKEALKEIDLIQSYSKGMDEASFEENPAILDGIVFRMVQTSEHIRRVSDSFKKEHPEIDWISIRGFRNRLVHDYEKVDLEFVYLAINRDVPELKEKTSSRY